MKANFARGRTIALFVSFVGAGCSSDGNNNPGAGGATGSGGAPAGSSGRPGTSGSPGMSGSPGTSGSPGAAGSPVTNGGGGNAATAGSPATGGSTAGQPASGGASGGSPSAGAGGAIVVAGAGGGSAGTTMQAGSGGVATAGSGGGGAGGPATSTMGPCDIYKAGNTPCVAAYSTIRRISSTYTGPLYQVRSGSSAQNTGEGGKTHDIPMTADGFADKAVQDEACKGTFCTISMMYDQSGKGNHLTVAKRGRSDGGQWADDDDFESKADAGPLKVAGHDVYSLYMEPRQGYRMTKAGDGVPRGTAAQGIYMLADGTRVGDACCWDFGNVTPDPTTYHVMNTLFFGWAYWGEGAQPGPWFMADFEAGVWAGGSKAGDPGWGALDTTSPPNTKNPALPVKYAIGFLKTDKNYALRMADIAAANALTTAYDGPLPKAMDNQGAIVIGVGGDNSNNSKGTFYEGAVVAGYPSPETEDAVMQNVKAAGYGR